VGDPVFDELHESSPEFREWWPRHEVQGDAEADTPAMLARLLAG
jgi:hypothetical protein